MVTEDSSTVLNARFLIINGADPQSGFPLDAPDGSVTSPPFTFEQSGTTGVFLVSDNVTFAVDGVSAMTVSMEGNISFGGGAPLNYGGATSGEGILFLHECVTAPGGVAGGGTGGVLYVSGNSLNFTNAAGVTYPLSSNTGDVFGPAVSSTTAAVLFDGASGKLIKNSSLLITETATLTTIDGSVTNTAYSFETDTNTGLILDTDLKFVTAGAARVEVSLSRVYFTAVVDVPDGTSGAPSYSFTTSPTTGMLLSTTKLQVGVGGTVALTVDNVGKNIVLGGSVPLNYGAGTSGGGVVFLHEATTIPVGLPNNGNGGGVLYVSGNVIGFLQSTGVAHDLTRCLQETSGTTNADGVVRFDSTSGILVKNTSTLTVDASGQWAGPTGLVSNVTYGFSGDPDTGMYRAGVSSLNFAAGGVDTMILTTTTATLGLPMHVPDGNSTAPTYAFAPSSNSGIFRMPTGSIAFCAGGTVAATFRENTSFCGTEASTYGGGDGILFITRATTLPTTNPTGGGLLYVDGTNLMFRDSTGRLTILSEFVIGPVSSTDNAVALWDGTGGINVQNSTVTVSDAGALQSGDGAVGTPGLSFSSVPTTGMYISGANVYFTAGGGAGGVGQLLVDASSVTSRVSITGVDGAVAAPSYTFTGDVNTGIYSAGVDALGVSVGGIVGLLASLAGAVTNVGLGGSSYGGGQGVVFLDEVTVAPVGTLTSGGILYVSGTSLIFHDSGGGTRTLNGTVYNPVSANDEALGYWSGTGGDTIVSATTLTSDNTRLFGKLRYASDALSISPSASRVLFQFGSGSGEMYVGATGTTVTGVPTHADLSLRVGGTLGVTESQVGAVYTMNNPNATGTFQWQQNGTSIFETTTPLNLNMANRSVEWSSATETMTLGLVASNTYAFTSTTTDTTPKDINFNIGGTTYLRNTPTGTHLTNTSVIPTSNYNNPDGSFLGADGTIAAPTYSFINAPTSGFTRDASTGALVISKDAALSACVSKAAVRVNVAFCTPTCPTTFDSGDGIIYIGQMTSAPTLDTTGAYMYVESTSNDLRLDVAFSNANANCVLNATSKRAHLTLALAVGNATSDDLDDEVWTDVNSSGVTHVTLGAPRITDSETTVMVDVRAEWASNTTGYRRVSITTGASHTVEATSTVTAVNGTSTCQTTRLIRRIEVGEENLAFAVQAYQNAGGALDANFTMTFVRLN